ncbi:RING-3 [Leptodontidium sp. MPI-SDFR-AT-0119]|nr:RING-3 [Leptodontidium sp. MPI-SDFR-AT-0119]
MSVEQQKSRKVLNKVRQACKCCRSRKIRCDNFNPCQNCQRINLPCVYQIPKKKGPRRRETVEEIPRSVQSEPSNTPEYHNAISPAPFTAHFQPSFLLSLETIQNCLDSFFTHKYPVMPILDREETYASLRHLHNSPTQYGLITSLCAVIMMQTEILVPSDKEWALDNSQQFDSMLAVDFLIKETCRARACCDHVDNPSLASVQSSFFLFTCFSRLGKDNSAWVHLRESITMLQLLRLHEETSYSTISDPKYVTYSRRTFWLLFITEQAYALQRHRPLTLRRPINLPVVEDGREAAIIYGFLDSIDLFRHFGDGFMSLWNSAEGNGGAAVSPQPLIKLQEFLKCAIPNVRERIDIQQADLLVTRQWLKMIVWQLCLNKGMLSSNATTDSISFHYPVDIARDVTLVARFLPLKAFQANGVGILGKIFDIGWSLADVLLVHPHILHTSSIEVGPKDYLMDLVRILDMDIRGHSKYLQLLATRADECLGVRVPRSLSAGDGSPAVCEIDWDEGIIGSDEVYGSPGSSSV